MKRLPAISTALLFGASLAAAAEGATTTFFDENGAYYGPDCDETNYSGAYYTGDYTSPFKKYLGKTDEEIQAKLDQLWDHYFKGDNNSKVFYDKGTEAYIKDTGNNDVRSEGMSYGMMISVQKNSTSSGTGPRATCGTRAVAGMVTLPGSVAKAAPAATTTVHPTAKCTS